MRIVNRQQGAIYPYKTQNSQRQNVTAPPASSNTDTDSDTVIMSEEGVGTRLYTAKLLIEQLFGKASEKCITEANSQSPAKPTPQSASQAGSSFSVGQTIPLDLVQAQAIDITWQHTQQVTFTLQTDTERLDITASVTDTKHLRIEVIQAQEADPLIFDLAGDGVNLRSVDNPVSFDIDGDGQKELMGFVQGDDAILTIRPKDGEVINGMDFIGNRPGAVNGFEELRRLDSNSDGQIDASDKNWGDLVLVQDKNADGEISNDEFITPEQAGIKSISTGYQALNEQNNGQRLIAAGEYTTQQGAGRIVDAMLLYRETADTGCA